MVFYYGYHIRPFEIFVISLYNISKHLLSKLILYSRIEKKKGIRKKMCISFDLVGFMIKMSNREWRDLILKINLPIDTQYADCG